MSIKNKKPIDLTPKSLPEIPAKEKIVIPEINYEMGTMLGGIKLGGDDSTINNRSVKTIADAVNVNGNFINDVINARFDSSSKKILSDFNFGTTNYAGAVKSGNIAWDVNGENITGSGVALYRKGIVGAFEGVVKFSLNAETGDATFAGTLVAAAGTLGKITAGVLNLVNQTTNTTLLSIDNVSTLQLTYDLVSLSVQNSDSTGRALAIAHYGTGHALEIIANGGGAGIIVTKQTGEASYALQVNQRTDYYGIDLQKIAAGAGTALNIQNSGAGSSLVINQSITSAGADAVSITNKNNNSRILYLNQTGDTANVPVAYFGRTSGTGVMAALVNSNSSNNFAVLALSNAGIVSVHFNKMIIMGGVGSMTIWLSDGTTPDGNLTGVAGDICFGADSGKAYYCPAAGTVWTAM